MVPVTLSSAAPQPGLVPAPQALQQGVRHALSATDIAAAERFSRELTHSHYENFSVISFLLPRHLRQDFCNVYAFCRSADDAADEIADQDQSLRLLASIRRELHETYAGRPVSPIFIALSVTIERHSISIEPFDHLLDAFEQDRRINRYQTYAQLVAYCQRSADPVGRLVLWMCGYRDAQRQQLSDRICTGLQLANFWQDIRRDLLDRDRIYLPAESMDRFGITESSLRQQVAGGHCETAMRRLIEFEVDRAAALFDQGDALLPMLDRSLRAQISLFSGGGRAVLSSIRAQNYDTLSKRPSLSKWQKGHLITTALFNRLLHRPGMPARQASVLSATSEAKA
jgi:squalene synthase HpnC